MTPFSFGSRIWPGTAKLFEEMGELTQVLGKLLMLGGRTDHWSGDLRIMLVDELADVQAALRFFVIHCLTDDERKAFAERTSQKLTKFEGWHAP